MLRKTFGSKREVQETGENYVNRSFVISTPHKILSGRPKKKRKRCWGACGTKGETSNAYVVLVGRTEATWKT